MAQAGEKRAAIDISTATTTAVITTAATETFEIVKMFLHSSGTNGVTFKSNATALCGKLDMVAQERFILDDEDGVAWFRGLVVNDDFNIVTTQNVQLSGVVVYRLSNG